MSEEDVEKGRVECCPLFVRLGERHWAVAWIRRRATRLGIGRRNTHRHTQLLGKLTRDSPSPPRRVPGNDPAFVTPSLAARPCSHTRHDHHHRLHASSLPSDKASGNGDGRNAATSLSVPGLRSSTTGDPSDAKTSTTIDQSDPPRSPAPIPRSPNYRHGPPSTRPTARQSKHPPGSAQL
jgi:hypothetical protein